MISFYPGPSRVYDEIPRYVKQAFKEGILSINHRSGEFMKISEKAIGLLKKKLNIPDDYAVFYTSSATECWEIIAQSVITGKSYHIFNGAFGEKWFDYTRRIRPGAESIPFDVEELIDPERMRMGSTGGVICITQNETSNGTQVSNEALRAVHENNPGHLLAVDATSSMAGIELDFTAADIWLASVQKCFGLPAGLGLLFCSPKAMDQARFTGEHDHYNSLTFMGAMMEKWQTPYTPNVLNIYLLMRVMENSPPVGKVHRKIRKRYEGWIRWLEDLGSLGHLVSNPQAHSYTVVPVTGPAGLIASAKATAKKEGLLLGEGYGKLKDTTFRIANFPAIKISEIARLQRVLQNVG